MVGETNEQTATIFLSVLKHKQMCFEIFYFDIFGAVLPIELTDIAA